MDVITESIVAALEAGLNGEGSNLGSNIKVIRAYKALRNGLSKVFGPKSDLLRALAWLEQKPHSPGRRAVLQEEVDELQAGQEPDMVALAKKLQEALHAGPDLEPLAPPLPIPLLRPARTGHFLGRETELKQLQANVRSGQVVALCGPSGIGKTTLAIQALWEIAPDNGPPPAFPDGIIYHNFYNQPRVDIALSNIVRAFGQDPMPTAYDAAERILADKQALLVLDSVDQADDLSGLLELRGGCAVLVILNSHSDQEILDSITIRQDVAPLPPEATLKLLEMWSEVKLLDTAAARQICELVGQSPLAIRLIGHYLAARQETMANYQAWLSQTALAEMEPEQRRQESVSVILERSLAQLTETAHQALALMGLLAMSPFDEQALVKALTTTPEHNLLSTIKGIFKPKPVEKQPDVIHILNELVNYGLLWWRAQHPQLSHPFIHAYVRRHFQPSPGMVRHLAAYYTALAWEQRSLGPEGYERLDQELPHLMRILNECLERTDWEAAHGLAAAIEDYLDRQGYWVERVIANEAGLVAAWQLGRPSEGAWLGNLGDTYRTMGHAGWAIEHFKKALDTARRSGDPYSEANSLGNLGLAYRDLGQIDQAREHLQQSLAIFDRVNSPSADLVRDWLLELEDWDEEL